MWTIIFLITKENTDTQGIVLLGFLWEMVEAIIDTHLRVSVRLHNVLHGFHSGKGTGASILELNLVQ